MREDLRLAFRKQAESCRELGSAFNGALCDLLAERLSPSTAFARRIEAWGARPVPDALALRAVGGLHALARSGRAPELTALYPPAALPELQVLWRVVAASIEQHDAYLEAYLASPPQTNEVGRAAALLGVALRLGAEFGFPLYWYELGASAGLNLGFDGFRYQLEQADWGPESAPVLIRARWSGAHPPVDAPLSVAERAGCDVQPLDPGSAVDRERLLSYVWPDQTERVARTSAALSAAAASSLRVERAQASSWLASKLGAPAKQNTLRVVAHTIVWQYLGQAERSSLRATLARAGAVASAETPLAWFSMEADGQGPGAVMKLTVWAGQSEAGDERTLGRADFHGRWVAWA